MYIFSRDYNDDEPSEVIAERHVPACVRDMLPYAKSVARQEPGTLKLIGIDKAARDEPTYFVEFVPDPPSGTRF